MNQSSSQSFALPGSNYGYTGIPVDEIETQDNTLAVGAFDQSGSTRPFKLEIENCNKEIVKSCRSCPAADRLIYRLLQFDNEIKEYHGYKPLNECNVDDYTDCWDGGGATNLFGAVENVCDSIVDYAEQQAALRYNVNAIAYFMTDGRHYMPGGSNEFTLEKAKAANQRALNCEALESIQTILIGITGGDDVLKKELEDFATECQFTQFVDIKDADEKTLAKIANFISQSVASQSQALGSGGPSQSIAFTF